MSNIAVVFGGPTPEHDISILTGLQVSRKLQGSGRTVTCVYWSKAGDWYELGDDLEAKHFVEGVPANAKPLRFVAAPGGGFLSSKKKMFGDASPLNIDVVVNCCHGGPGEDGTLQGAFDLAGLKYTGPTSTGAALGMDKLAFGGVIEAAGLPSLPRRALREGDTQGVGDGPIIVKPRFGGSSIGVEVVDRVETAQALLRTSPHLRAGGVIEPYLADSFDINVGVRMFPRFQASPLEKPLRSSSASVFLNYGDKYTGGEGMASAPRELPANLGEEMTALIRSMAETVAQLVGLRGIARIDFLVQGNKVYVNEINTIPGSLAHYLFVEPHIAFETLLDDMIREAQERPSTQWTTQGADGSALRSAGSIASKLA